jgi:hypothetical protein
MVRVAFVFIVAVLAGSAGTRSFSQEQVVDLQYDTSVAHPAYTARHPAVLVDAAHNNLHTAGGLYKPFASLIANDGYRVATNRKAFSKEVLEPQNILVIANAAGSPNRGGLEAANPAFAAAECEAVEAWVKAGGSFLFVTDQHPYGGAAQNLAKRFGVGMSQGQTLGAQNSMPRAPSNLIFARENELLGDHPIIWGRGPSEQINRVVTYSGQSLLGPRGSVAFLRLADSAMDRFLVDDTLISAAGRSQGLVFIHGRGRVVVLGEAGTLTAQSDRAGRPFGINVEGTDNRQLALNIMHWLSGLIPANRRSADGKPATSRRSSSGSRQSKSRIAKQAPPQGFQP